MSSRGQRTAVPTPISDMRWSAAVAAGAGGSGDRVSRRAFVTGLGAVLAAPLGAVAHPAVVQGWQTNNALAPRLGVKLRRFHVSVPDGLETAIATMAQERVGGMTVPADDRLNAQRGLIGALAAKHRLPWLGAWPIIVEAGALMSYSPDHRHMWQRVIWYVDRILKGAKPADMPIEQPTKFELVINLKTAK